MKKRPTSIAASASGKGKSESRKRRYIQLNPQAPFSEGVLVGNTLYLSGYIGVDQSGNHVPDDIETEARNVMNGIGSVLQKAGMTFLYGNNLTKSTAHILSVRRYPPGPLSGPANCSLALTSKCRGLRSGTSRI